MRKNKKMFLLSLCLFILFSYTSLFSQTDEASSILGKYQESVVFFTCFGEGKEEISKGSGFIIRQGILATSYHIVSEAKSAEGRNFKGKKVKIEGIIAVDKKFDIALLSVKSKGPAISLGNSDDLGIGRSIYAMGGKENGEIAVTDGTVRGILEFAPNQRIFDTTLVVSESFCGGAVFDKSGQLMGMMAYLEDGSRYVLPINRLKSVQKTSPVTKFSNRNPEEYFSTLDGAYLAGRIYYSLDKSTRAERALNEVIKQKPDELDAHILLASVYSDQRNYSSSVSAYKKIIELRPNLDTAHFGLGVVYLKMRRWREAIAPLEKAVQLNMDNKEAYFHIGMAYQELTEFEKASEAYKSYLQTNPENRAEVYRQLGICQEKLERYEDAVVSFQEALKGIQDEKIQFQLAQAYQKSGQYDNAAEVFRKLAEFNPDDAKVYYNNIVMMYDDAKMPDKAIGAAQKMIELNPKDADAIYNLGYMFIKQKKYNEAVETFKKAIELRPEMEYAYANIGYAYMQLKKYKDAIDIYNDMIKIFPDNFNAWVSIGMGYMHQKKFAPAVEPLKKAIELKPDNGTAYYNLAICYLNLQDRYSAREIYNKLKTIDASLAQKLVQYLN